MIEKEKRKRFSIADREKSPDNRKVRSFMGNYLVDYENVKKDGLHGIDRLGKKDRVYIFYSENADTLTFELHKKINESDAGIDFQKVEVGTKNALDFQLSTLLGYLVARGKEEEYFIVSNDNGFHSVCNYWEKNGVKVSIIPEVAAGEVILKNAAEKESRQQRGAFTGEEIENGSLTFKADELLREEADRKDRAEQALFMEQDKAETKINKKQKKEALEKALSAGKGMTDKNKKAEKELLYQDVSKVIADGEVAKMVAEYIQKCKTKQELNNTLIKKYPSKNNKRASEIYQAVKPLLKNKKGN